ncbi:glutaredoxin-1-like [Prionailurus viverrinus]|uniref:glutaredoxin-1-like n=1 Tax=Prionailurus viverrinus TaxID=61388 RepID=UPI001FF5DF83|nr:glutaredoxin-1-like [Prionailurus viverrinus]
MPKMEDSSLGGSCLSAWAQEFVNSKIQPGNVVVFIKPTCSYRRRIQELLSQLSSQKGFWNLLIITATSYTIKIQNYLKQLTRARKVPWVFIGKDCISGCTYLTEMHHSGELLKQLKQIRGLQ